MPSFNDLQYQLDLINFMIARINSETIRGNELEMVYKSLKLLEDYRENIASEIAALTIPDNEANYEQEKKEN